MRRLSSWLVVWGSLSLSLVAGCGPAVIVRVRHGYDLRHERVRGSGAHAVERAEHEIPCSRRSMVLQELRAGGYRIEGCGVAVTYTCVGQFCSPDHWDRSGAAVAAADDASSGWTDGEAREIARRVRDDLGPCFARSRESIGMTIELMPGGRLRRVSATAPLTDDQITCVDTHLAGLELRARVPEPRRIDIELGPPAPPPAPATAAPARPASPDAAARAAVDGRAPAILACVDAPALALQVSWSAEGRLDALLRGAHQGTPEEACVRAAVQSLAIPAPGAPGTLVHAVQR